MLGNNDAQPLRLVSPPAQGRDAILRFLFDYSSHGLFSLVRLRRLIEEVLPVKVKIEYIPILVGAVFKKIGTPVVMFITFVFKSFIHLFFRYQCKCWLQLGAAVCSSDLQRLLLIANT